MDACSSYIFMKKGKKKATSSNEIAKSEPEINLNVVEILYGGLKDCTTYVESTPVPCKQCASFYNKFSKALNKEEYENEVTKNSKLAMSDAQKAEKTEEEVKFEKEGIVSLKDEQKAWICEFCTYHNVIEKDTHVPTKEDMYYMLEKAVVKEPAKTTTEGEPDTIEVSEDDSNMIFCIDISGSMDCSERGKDGKYVTRLNAVKKAIQAQLEDLKKTFPQRQIGVVLFESTVHVLGDCTKPATVLKESELNDFDKLYDIGKKAVDNNFNQPLRESYHHLQKTIGELHTKGITALGPALVVSLGMATGRPGSQLIVCTDGLANKGMGNVESSTNNKEAETFYNKVADYAVDRGISVSVLTIAGTQCKIELLGPLTDRTAGTITKIDASSLTFEDAAKDAIIATNVMLKIILHKGLAFSGQEKINLNEDESVLVKKIGNVTERNDATVEFRIKNEDELEKQGIDMSKLENIPLQAQIEFTDMKGNKLVRVISRQQKFSENEEEIEKNANLKLIGNHIQKQTAEMAIKGEYKDANKKNKAFQSYMVNNSNLGQNLGLEVQKQYQAEWVSDNCELQQACDDIMVQPSANNVQTEAAKAKLWKGKQAKKK